MIVSLPDVTAGLMAHANDDLARVWSAARSATSAEDILFATIPALTEQYAAAAAAAAALWYDQHRDSLGISGRFSADPVTLTGLGADALVGWGSQPLLGESPDWAGAQTRIAGGFQRRVFNAARDTITTSSLRDPRATGWQRVGAGACAFCAMLIGRGAVYSEQGAQFAAHDHCHCSAVPAFDGLPVPVQPYTPSAKRVSDADRARVRDYLATH